MKTQTLPFRIRILKTAAELSEVIIHRSRGYGRRSEQMGQALSMPEAEDQRAPGREILIATSKMDGAIIGSLRLHVGLNQPTAVERHVDLPAPYRDSLLMDANRFCFTGGIICRSALFKGSIAYGLAHGARHFVLATLPSIEPLYASVGFVPIFSDDRLHAIPTAQNLPHRAMALSFESIQEDIGRRRPAMVDFLFNIDHGEDISISGALALA